MVPGDWACYISHVQMDISKENLQELTEIIEDTVEYFCDKQQASGQVAWTVVQALSESKLRELNGQFVPVIG